MNGSRPLDHLTLVIDESKFDEVLLNKPDDVRNLFSFRFSSDNPDVTLVNFGANTSYKNGGYNLEVTVALSDEKVSDDLRGRYPAIFQCFQSEPTK